MGDYKTIVENKVREGFEGNNTVFGRILQGKLPSKIIYEDDRVLAFKDIHPASDFHFLVIPKKHIKRIDLVEPGDEDLIRHMTDVAEKIAHANGILDVNASLKSGELGIGYHKYPFIMINHLHLHVVFPLPAKRWHQRMILFPKGYGRYFWPPEKCIQTYFK